MDLDQFQRRIPIIAGAAIIVAITGFLVTLLLSKHLQTVKGPETRGLAAAWHGTIVYLRPDGIVVKTKLPSFKTLTVRTAQSDHVVDQLSGPGKNGAIALVLDNLKKSGVYVLCAGRRPICLVSHNGSAMWDNYFGTQIALSPSGREIGLLSDCKSLQMENPSALLHQGTLQIWNTGKPGYRVLRTAVEDGGLSWFPDESHLAYVKLVSRVDMPGAQTFGKNVRWSTIPAVCELDLHKGTSTVLGAGWNPIVSTDGKSIIVQEWDSSLQKIDLRTHRIAPVTVPGLWGNVVAFDGVRLMYWGYPTEGSRPKYTVHNSPLSGPKEMMSLKTAVINSGKFQTILPYLDPRDVSCLSFGRT
jgi:hypothetical protein